MVVASVTSGYVLEKTVGDGTYSNRDAAFDIGIGAMGGAVIGPTIKVGAKASVGIARYLGKARKHGKLSDEAGQAIIASVRSSAKHYKPIGVSAIGESTKAGLGRFMSSGSRSEGNASKVGPGGNTPGVYEPRRGHETTNGVIVAHGCKPGFVPRWHRHKDGRITAICVPLRFARKKIAYE